MGAGQAGAGVGAGQAGAGAGVGAGVGMGECTGEGWVGGLWESWGTEGGERGG